jgi:hypothetical protein
MLLLKQFFSKSHILPNTFIKVNGVLVPCAVSMEKKGRFAGLSV